MQDEVKPDAQDRDMWSMSSGMQVVTSCTIAVVGFFAAKAAFIGIGWLANIVAVPVEKDLYGNYPNIPVEFVEKARACYAGLQPQIAARAHDPKLQPVGYNAAITHLNYKLDGGECSYTDRSAAGSYYSFSLTDSARGFDYDKNFLHMRVNNDRTVSVNFHYVARGLTGNPGLSEDKGSISSDSAIQQAYRPGLMGDWRADKTVATPEAMRGLLSWAKSLPSPAL